MITNANTSLENKLVWSAYRVKTLGRCERKYFYNFIGSWSGWETSSPPEVQAAYRVKNLTTPELEIGNILHERIRLILEKARAGRSIDPATEIQVARESFRTFVAQSLRRRLETITRKRRKLFIHEVGEPFTEAQLSYCLARVETLMRGFFEFADVKMLLADPAVLLPEFLDPSGFEIGDDLGVPARPRTDAVFVTPDKVVIADWKSGPPNEDHRDQGLVYDLYVRGKLALAPSDRVEIRFYHLESGFVVPFEFTDEEREERCWSIGEEFQGLKQYSDDPVINTGSKERFPARVSGACLGCNHCLMCPEFLRSRHNKFGLEAA